MADPPTKIKILLTGEEYHAKVFNDQLENYEKSIFEPKYYSKLPPDDELELFDIYHLISSPLPVINKLEKYSKPILYHWIGTDVHRILNDSLIKRYFKKLIINSNNVFNLVVSQNLKTELQKIKIDSRVLPLTKLNIVDDLPASRQNLSVLSYIPEKRWDFYHGETIIELASKLPQIDFHILAAAKKNSDRTNVFYYNFVDDVTPFYKKCSVLIRLTVHDGLPKMVLEALSNGMQVLWNEPFPHCYKVKNVDDCISVLKAFESGCPMNSEGKKYVEEFYNEPKIMSDYYQLCKEILQDQ